MLSSTCSNIENDDSSRIKSAKLTQSKVPLFIGRQNKDVISVNVEIAEDEEPVVLRRIEVSLMDGFVLSGIESFSVYHSTGDSVILNDLIGSSAAGNGTSRIKIKKELLTGNHTFSVGVKLDEMPDLLTRFQVENVTLHFSNNRKVVVEPDNQFTYRLANVVRAAGQDNCDTYRIPGMITTNNGTLIAVYDNRYNNSKDLQEDIDVGMSRSTDGGQTWEPMKVIMDMGEWGGRTERLNGIGDPAVLYDHTTNTIWVAGLWISGFSEKICSGGHPNQE